MAYQKFILDTNCFIDAANDPAFRSSFIRFCEAAAPGLYLSAVVMAELRAGARERKSRERLERDVFAPYLRRGRVVTPSLRCWSTLGSVLAELGEREKQRPTVLPRSLVFDVLIAQSCREIGAVLISRNVRDLSRIAKLSPFEFEAPFPEVM